MNEDTDDDIANEEATDEVRRDDEAEELRQIIADEEEIGNDE